MKKLLTVFILIVLTTTFSLSDDRDVYTPHKIIGFNGAVLNFVDNFFNTSSDSKFTFKSSSDESYYDFDTTNRPSWKDIPLAISTDKRTYYGTCSTAKGDANKVVTLEPLSDTNKFILTNGVMLTVKFSSVSSASSPKLVINNTTNLIKRIGTTADSGSTWSSGEVVSFVFDGTNWMRIDGGLATTSVYGKTLLQTSATSTKTDRALTPASLNNYSLNAIFPYPIFSSSSTYTNGARVRYNYNAWICTNEIATAKAWDEEDWIMIDPIQEQLDNLAADKNYLPATKFNDKYIVSSNVNFDVMTRPTINNNRIAITNDIKNGQLTVKTNGTSVGTFTANQSDNTEIDIAIPDISDLEKIKQAIDYDTEVGIIQYEERNGELWVTNAIAENGTVKIPAYKDGKPVRGIKYNATFTNADLSSLYFYGTELEVLRHDKIENGKTVLDYYEHPNWSIFPGGLCYVHMPFVKEIPDWYFLCEMPVGYNKGFGEVYFPNVEKIGSYAFANSGFYIEGYDEQGDDKVWCTISFPSLKFVGANAFIGTKARNVYVPELLEMDASTFGSEVTNLYAPKVRIVRGITSGTSTNNPNFRLPFQTNSCFKNIEHVYLPSCEEIGNNVFHFEDAIDTLDKPKSVSLPKCKRVGDENLFFNVSKLYMPNCVDWNGRFTKDTSIKSSSYHGYQKNFPPNTNLTSVVLGTKTLNDNAFRKCVALTNAEFPNLETGANWAFAGCTNLLTVDMPKLIHGANYMFYNCNKLRYGNFPELLDVGKKMFSGCSKIERVVFEKDVGKKNSGNYHFDYENGIIILPKVQYIGTEAFRAYDPADYTPPEEGEDEGTWNISGNLMVVNLPTIKEIGPSAFRGQRKLYLLNIPKCELIDEAAFQRCSSIIEDEIAHTNEDIHDLFGNNRQFNLPNVRRINSRAFANVRFGHVKPYKENVIDPISGLEIKVLKGYGWFGLTINVPNATYIAPDAFEDTWKILEIYAPNWTHEYSLFEYKNQFDWGHRKQDGDHSLTNIVWTERDYVTDLYGERVNLYQKIHSTFTRKLESTDEDDSYTYRTTLPKSYGYVYESDDWGTSNYKLGPFSINEDDILTITFKAAPIGNNEVNHTNLWTENDCYDHGGGIYFSAWDEDDGEWYYDEYVICDLDNLNQRPWIAYQRHDHGQDSSKPSWYQMDIINEAEPITITLSNIESDDLYVRIYSDFSYLCLADVEVRINGKLKKLMDLPNWVNNQITQFNNQLDNRISTNVYAIISNLVINGGLIIDNTPYKLVIEDASTSFTKLQFNNGNTIWTNIIGNIPNSYYQNNTSLTNVIIGNNVTIIGNSAFYGCSGLTSVTIPDSVTSIGSEVFTHCSGLTSVTIPASVMSIGTGAFRDCSNLTSVTIPNSVTSIGIWGFRDCSNLTSVTFEGKTKAQVQAMSNYSNWFYNVPSGLILHCIDEDIEYN